MQLSHTRPVKSAVFDDPNLVSSAGLVPAVRLATLAGLAVLADRHLSVPADKGANAGGKVTPWSPGWSPVPTASTTWSCCGTAALGRVFDRAYAPSTLGSFLRAFTFGHVRQLDAVASRFLTGLADRTPLVLSDDDRPVLVDVDDTIIEVHGHAKQGAGFGYSRVRGLNALIATASTGSSAPVVVAQRLRKGACGSPRGAARLVADALKTVALLAPGRPVLVRADSAFYGRPTIGAALRAGAQVSVTVRLDPKVKKAIAAIGDDAWTPIQYTDAIRDEETGAWISAAEVAEIGYTAFSSRPTAEQVPGRLVVRRIPDANAEQKKATGQGTLFDTWRFHAFFTTTTPPPPTPSPRTRPTAQHAIIENVHADLKNSALAHLPSGKFTANAAWLVLAVIAFNLTRAAACIAGTGLAKATTATIRRKLIHVPARVASSARQLTLHLPAGWPWQHAWTRLFTRSCGPPPALAS